MTERFNAIQELFAVESASGGIGRREFLLGAAALGLLPSTLSFAAAKEIVLAMYGGPSVEYYEEVWGKPYFDETGVKVVMDGTGPTEGKIRAMVQSGAVTWDLCDSDLFTALKLGGEGLLEKIDYSVVDKNLVGPALFNEFGIGNYMYSHVLAYDKNKVPDFKGYSQFFDQQAVPGKRGLWKYMIGALEAVLIADGVPADKLYPIDEKRAFALLKKHRDDIVLWDTAAASQQMFRDGEIVMGNIWHTRAHLLSGETNGQIAWGFEDGLVVQGGWVVPKGNPAGPDVFKFIQSTLRPKAQIRLLELNSSGPTNREANEGLPPALAAINPGSPENYKQQIPLNVEWYATQYDRVLGEYLDLMSS